jgi:hypothetical protein
LINLFKGYRAANDVEFADFIRRKVNSYEEGEDVNANNLMADALTKYKARKLTDEWSAPTKEQGQILALTAQVELLSKSSKKLNSSQAKFCSQVWEEGQGQQVGMEGCPSEGW